MESVIIVAGLMVAFIVLVGYALSTINTRKSWNEVHGVENSDVEETT